jgi:signal transduction histidine kinase
MLAVAVTFVAVGVIAIRMTTASMQAEFDDALRIKAQEIAARIEQDDGVVRSEVDPKSFGPNEAFEVWLDGKQLAKSGPELVAEADHAISGTTQRQITLRTLPRPEPDDHNPLPPIQIVYSRSTAEVSTAVAHMTRVLVGVGLVGVVACLVMLLVVIRAALAPVSTLANAIARIREDDLSTRVESSSTAAELVPIAVRLDELLGRVAKAFERERELTAEVGHELRTPLAGLRATLELALDRERPAERYRTALQQSLAITLETERVVEAVLSLARLDAGQAVANETPIDLDQVVRDAATTIEKRAISRQIDIVSELEPVSLMTDRDKLRVVLVNLFDNAVTYANDGGEIRISLVGQTLRVINTGCTLAPAQVAHVFDRFWRADAARSGGHVGIGLALCKKLVDLLGGTLEATVRDGRFIATVVLP